MHNSVKRLQNVEVSENYQRTPMAVNNNGGRQHDLKKPPIRHRSETKTPILIDSGLDLSCYLRRLLRGQQFPDVTLPAGFPRTIKHRTVHLILTISGPHILLFLPLGIQQTKIVKKEFAEMIKVGTARMSSNPWSLLLHLAPKICIFSIDKHS